MKKILLLATISLLFTFNANAFVTMYPTYAPSGQLLSFSIWNYQSTQPYAAVGMYADASGDYPVNGNLVLPSYVTYNGQSIPVKSVGTIYGDSLLSVVIPSPVETIESSISGPLLSSITIAGSVTYIADGAFYNCPSLTSISIPSGVTHIGYATFANCTSLTSVNIPDAVTSIGDFAFNGCTSLSSISIPDAVDSIGNYAFGGCMGLTSVTIPNGVTFIGENPFVGCSALSSIVVDAANAYYDSRNGCNAIIETATNTLVTGCQNTVIPSAITTIGIAAFEDCTGLTSVTIPSSVTTIGGYAFYGCTGLPSISIPNGVTEIGYAAFAYCSGLTELTSRATVAPFLNQYVFYEVSPTIPVNIPCGSQTSYSSDSEWSNFSNFVEVGFTVSATSSDNSKGQVDILSTPTCTNSTATVSATANTDYSFSHWSDGNTDNPRTLALTSDTAIVGYFAALAGDTVYVHDTIYLSVHDTTVVTDTLTITEYQNVYVHDTTVVVDTMIVNHYIYDTVLINNYIYDTVTETEYVTVHDTTYLTEYEYIYDTTYITLTDTVTNTIYDTVTNTVYDTIDNYIYDTTVVTDTLWMTEYDTIYITLYDTVYIHDTVYVTGEGIGDVEATSVKLYQRDGQIVVEGAEGLSVRVYDAVGREVNGKRREENGKMAFAVPTSGVYLVRVGDHPARRVVVIR